MSTEAHISSLQTKKSVIERAIVDESLRPSPDTIRLSQLKRQKLRLKEEIQRHDHTGMHPAPQ